ncbi:MAG: GatB/YqeY domain-containing protein [Microgenomates group bacterium]|jgi:uncharacterized protein YqeY|nr:GatB/YqeY domain-containing protein [Microgenomates group bacterium]
MLTQKIQIEQIKALKSGDKPKLATLRYILAQLQNKRIAKQAELTKDEEIAVLKKIAKELKESIDSFEKGKRLDLVDQSKKQLTIVSSYLPPELSDEELKKEIEKIIQTNQEIYQKNRQAIIGIVMKQLKSKADSLRIMSILRSIINNKH